MDDPWGSPWATPDSEDPQRSDHHTDDVKPEPPPPAFISSVPSPLSVPSTQSAWLDDDAFGGWNSAEPAQSPATPGWGIWGSNDAAPGDGGQLTPRKDPKNKSIGSYWPRKRSTSPTGSLRPSTSVRRPSADRLSDPWASELSLNRDGSEPSSPLPQLQHLPALPAAADIEGKPPLLRSKASNVSITVDPPPISPPPTEHANESQIHLNGHLDRAAGEPDTSGRSSPVDHDAAPSSSHTKLPPGTNDDEQVLAQTGDRKASKVQKLVVMYDGIAKKSKTVQPEPLPAPKRTISQVPEFGDTQNGALSQTSLGEGTSLSVKKTRKIDRNDSDAALAAEKEIDATLAMGHFLKGDLSTSLNLGVSKIEERPGEARSEISHHAEEPHEPFRPDLGKLDDLFEVAASTVTGDDIVVPDRPITDSFESTSERKAWYRMSRFGPMRKHNTGNDENYARVSWADSTIRPEVIQTVRRWMEEDSMGGRLFRGTSVQKAGAYAFGWAQGDTSVDLSKVFGKRQSGQGGHASTHSVGSIASTMSASAVPPPKASELGVEVGPWPASAAFGWSSNSNVGASPVVENGHRSLKSPAIAEESSAAAAEAFAWGSEDKATPTAAFSGPTQTTKSSFPAIETDEEEDEWGDMVTPAVDSFAAGAEKDPMTQVIGDVRMSNDQSPPHKDIVSGKEADGELLPSDGDESLKTLDHRPGPRDDALQSFADKNVVSDHSSGSPVRAHPKPPSSVESPVAAAAGNGLSGQSGPKPNSENLPGASTYTAEENNEDENLALQPSGTDLGLPSESVQLPPMQLEVPRDDIDDVSFGDWESANSTSSPVATHDRSSKPDSNAVFGMWNDASTSRPTSGAQSMLKEPPEDLEDLSFGTCKDAPAVAQSGPLLDDIANLSSKDMENPLFDHWANASSAPTATQEAGPVNEAAKETLQQSQSLQVRTASTRDADKDKREPKIPPQPSPEEELSIREIIGGLPDLSYMLR